MSPITTDAHISVWTPLYSVVLKFTAQIPSETGNSPRPNTLTGLGGIHTIYPRFCTAPLRSECEQPFTELSSGHRWLSGAAYTPFRTLDPALVMRDVYRVANSSVSVILIWRHFIPSAHTCSWHPAYAFALYFTLHRRPQSAYIGQFPALLSYSCALLRHSFQL